MEISPQSRLDGIVTILYYNYNIHYSVSTEWTILLLLLLLFYIIIIINYYNKHHDRIMALRSTHGPKFEYQILTNVKDDPEH